MSGSRFEVVDYGSYGALVPHLGESNRARSLPMRLGWNHYAYHLEADNSTLPCQF
jgi:hypothetical protein